MNWRPPIRWATAGALGIVLLSLLPTRATAQGVQAPAPTTPPVPSPTAGEKAQGSEPALPPTGATIQPTPPPTAEIKPPPPPMVEARPPSERPPAEQPPLAGGRPKDQLPDAGYVPGYSGFYPTFGLSPRSPRVGGLPGGLTPGFAAPMPPSEWTFSWNGYLSASAQFSVNERVLLPGQELVPGQTRTVFHVPPQTLDEYQSFVGTATMPGNWVALNFRYGNRDVSANVTLSTWNPSQPTTYYQLGSQNFLQNAYLAYNIATFNRWKVTANAGYFYTNYGNLGQYGPGIYQNPVAGGPKGVGFRVIGEYQINPDLLLILEEGFMGNRLGQAPAGTAPANPNSGADPSLPASYIQHLHAGLIYKSDFILKANLHWMINFAMDDRVQYTTWDPVTQRFVRNDDTMFTRAINEAYMRDGKLSVLAADLQFSHSIWGILGVGFSHIDAYHAFPLRGLLTYGGEGQQITERWVGVDNLGTGKVEVAVINWTASLGRILSAPVVFDSNAPDILINAGAVVATSHDLGPSYFDQCNGQPVCQATTRTFDGRWRYKLGLDLLYAMLPWFSVGGRFDHVMPNSKDPDETFDVLAGRLVFKTDWASRETISLIGARWFYGPHTHPEYSQLQRPWLDQWLVALNVNLWW